MTTLEETKKNCEKPCLCDTCLKARDAELLRLRKTLLEECVEMGEELKKQDKVNLRGNEGYEDAVSDYQSKLREKIEALNH